VKIISQDLLVTKKNLINIFNEVLKKKKWKTKNSIY
jgi:hypothetical protein